MLVKSISLQLNISLSTIYSIWRRYKKCGDPGLNNAYSKCGPQTIYHDALMFRAVLWRKRLHPLWGAGRIRIRLEKRYDLSRIPSERTMQRWLRENNLTEPRQVRNEPRIGASRAVHNIWQVDAKEQLVLADGTVSCYLTVTDERSGAWLGAPAFPYHRICQVPLEEVRSALLKLFERWGKPGAMRVDNGEPLGTSRRNYTPVLSLWLIGMDVDMIWNKPACPQENGKVERMQGTSSRWAEPAKCLSLAHLQKRLDEEAAVQREQFYVKRLEYKTRLQIYPELETSRRVYDAQTFNVRRIYDFLSGKVYIRKTSPAGALQLYGELFRLGVIHKNKNIQIKLDPGTCEWQFFDDKERLITIKAEHLAQENILNLTGMSKNKTV